MLQLEYLLGGTPGQRREDRIDLAAAPGVELLYSCFVGNVQLVVGGADLSANFGWIPLLNFANNLDLILRRLNANETKTYSFTESQDWISFTRRGDSVEISCSYVSDVIAVASQAGMRNAARLAGLKLVMCIEERYPEITSNGLFADIASRLEAGP